METANPHGALLTIDAAAIGENWRLLAARAGRAECAGVVKADGYGLGIETVVHALTRAGCRSFFVAHFAEGMRARRAAPMAAIYVLNGLPAGAEHEYQTWKLKPVLGSPGEVGRWRAAGGGPCALHIDTGMNRLGLSMQEAKTLAQMNDWEGMGIDLLMSHFVASEEPENPVNDEQIARFQTASAWFGGRIPRRSLANSSGHFLPRVPAYEMTRTGYALYGGNPTPGRPNPMRPVVHLDALILQTRHVEAGEAVGYNGQWTAKRASRIATLSVGYADGWLRSLSATEDAPGGEAVVDGVRCPIVGRVSMDLVTIDVTDVPPTNVRAGQRATLIGEGIGVDDVAERAGTNGYEILTSLGSRYQRRVAGA